MSEGLRRIHIIFVVLTSLWAAGFIVAAASSLWESTHFPSPDGSRAHELRVAIEKELMKDVQSRRNVPPGAQHEPSPPPNLTQFMTAGEQQSFEQNIPLNVDYVTVVDPRASDRSHGDLIDVLMPDGRRIYNVPANINRETLAPKLAAYFSRKALLNSNAVREAYVSEAQAYVGVGLVPPGLYWTFVWVVAGFLQDRRARKQDN